MNGFRPVVWLVPCPGIGLLVPDTRLLLVPARLD
jgi:hypothetical protein